MTTDNTILVTGGAGYIGSHSCKCLAESGWHPVVFDNLVYGHPWAVQWGPLVEGNLSDGPLLDGVFRKHRPVAVLHFAAYAYVGESVTDPGKYYVNNVGGTLKLLETMREHDCRIIIFSSSCATYGMPETIPISEDHPQHPINPYGRSKLMIEQMLKDYDAAYEIRHMALRYFNAAGADPGGHLGEVHEPETHLIPLAIETALGIRSHLEIFGDDYPTVDGTAVRDYVHVSDLAEAHVRALQYLLEVNSSFQLNLGTGQGYSVLEVLNTIQEVSGREVPTKRGPRRAGDPPVLVAQADRARQLLGWRPKHSGLRTIVETAWKWHESQGAERGAQGT